MRKIVERMGAALVKSSFEAQGDVDSIRLENMPSEEQQYPPSLLLILLVFEHPLFPLSPQTRNSAKCSRLCSSFLLLLINAESILPITAMGIPSHIHLFQAALFLVFWFFFFSLEFFFEAFFFVGD